MPREELCKANLSTATCGRLLLPRSYDQFHSVPQARDQVELSLLAGTPPLLEANAWYL
jgi:hypothetical protein